MAKSYKNGRSPWVLLLLILVGGIVGSAATDAVAPYLGFVRAHSKVGFAPVALDLAFMQLTLGFQLLLSPLTALGMILGYIVYKKI